MQYPVIHAKNCRLITVPMIPDNPVGDLCFMESGRHIPFEIKRVYHITNIIDRDIVRGRHAHKALEQVFFCINGSCDIVVDDGNHRQTVRLENNHVGIYFGPELWHEMLNFSENCVLLVLASDYYDEADYIRDYAEFQRYLTRSRG